jgi:hypothetical protein
MCARTPTPTTWLDEAVVWSGAALVAVVLTILAGCSSVPIPPTYTQDELKAICERHGGWWHPDELVGGFCEYQQGVVP